jgi:hypothetical protein
MPISSDSANQLGQSEPDSSPVSLPELQEAPVMTSEDSVRAAILQVGIETRFLLSELYAYELNRPDSAIHEYLLIAKEHSDSPYAPKALLAASQMELNGGDTAKAHEYLDRLILEYPSSPQAAQAAETLKRPFDMTQNALGLYNAAESLVYIGSNPDSAIVLFKYISANYPDLAPKASFAVAWILDRIIGVEDSSAFQAYSSVAQKYPETVYANAANERMGLSSGPETRRPAKTQTQPGQPGPGSPPTGPDTAQQNVDVLPIAPNPKVLGEFIYPEALLSRDLKGKVIFKIKLDFAGKVAEYEIIGPSGEHAIDSSATAALLKSEFDVSTLDLAQLESYYQYSIPFRRPTINLYNDPYLEQKELGPD